MQQDIRILKQKCNAAMIALCSGQVWWSWVHAPLRELCQFCPIPWNCTRKRAKSSTTHPWIIWFRSNFIQSLNTWHPKCYKSSRSRGQRSRSQRDITCAKIRKIINNFRDCSISLKFRTDFDHVTLDVPRTFKVNRSKVKVTTWHNVQVSRNAIIQARMSCRRSNLVKIIREPSATLKVQVHKVIAITTPRIVRLRSINQSIYIAP